MTRLEIALALLSGACAIIGLICLLNWMYWQGIAEMLNEKQKGNHK